MVRNPVRRDGVPQTTPPISESTFPDHERSRTLRKRQVIGPLGLADLDQTGRNNVIAGVDNNPRLHSMKPGRDFGDLAIRDRASRCHPHPRWLLFRQEGYFRRGRSHLREN